MIGPLAGCVGLTASMDEEFEDPRLAAVYDVLDPDRSDLEPYLARVESLGARAKPGADAVRWLVGDASLLDVDELDLGELDVVTMTANVAMVLLTDEEAAATLTAVSSALGPDGHLIFETRSPEARAWQSWTREATFRRADLSDGSWVRSWVEVTGLRAPDRPGREWIVLARRR